MVQEKSRNYENLRQRYESFLQQNNIPSHPMGYVVRQGMAYDGYHQRNKSIESYRAQLTKAQAEIDQLKQEIVHLQNSIAGNDNNQ